MQLSTANTYACKNAIASSRPLNATVSASGATPKMPSAMMKPAKVYSMMCPAIMLTNSRTERLIGRIR
jgi:hypothetical protein